MAIDMRTSQSKYTSPLIHLIVWAIVLGMPLFALGSDSSMLSGKEYLHFLVVPLSFMAVFYVNYFYLIDKYLFGQHLYKFLAANVLLIASVIVAVHLISRIAFPMRGAEMPPERSTLDIIRFFSGNAMLYMLVVGAGVAIRMTASLYKAEAEKKELEYSNTQAELQNLKSQLNPHFLFNTLNNIYSLILFDTERAQKAVLDLGRMLRYVLYDSSQAFVPLSSEIQFLNDYIGLMRLRLPEGVRVEVSFPEAATNATIAPLLFISLVENAFKHGVSNDAPSFVEMRIEENDGVVSFVSRNSYYPKTDTDRSGSGIGLSNLSKRLEMIYPGKYSFEHGVADGCYTTRVEVSTNVR